MGRFNDTGTTDVNDHFLDLVDRGRCRGCSTSERRLRELAEGLLRAVPSLDAAAVAGLHEWIDYVKQCPTSAQEFLEG